MPGQQGGLFGWTLSCYGYKCYLDPLQYMIEYYIIGSNNTFTLYAIKFYVNIATLKAFRIYMVLNPSNIVYLTTSCVNLYRLGLVKASEEDDVLISDLGK